MVGLLGRHLGVVEGWPDLEIQRFVYGVKAPRADSPDVLTANRHTLRVEGGILQHIANRLDAQDARLGYAIREQAVYIHLE